MSKQAQKALAGFGNLYWTDTSGNLYSAPRDDLAEAVLDFDPYGGLNLIYREALPPWGRPKKRGPLPKALTSAWMRLRAGPRSADGTFPVGATPLGELEYKCETLGYGEQLDAEEQAEFEDVWNSETSATEAIKIQVELAKEYIVAASLFNATTWSGAALYTDVGSGAATRYWTDVTNATPIVDIVGNATTTGAKQRVENGGGGDANVLIVSKANRDLLWQNANVRNTFSDTYQIPGAPDNAALAHALGVDKILMGRAMINTSHVDTTPAFSPIWSNTYAMVANIPMATVERLGVVGLGRMVFWNRFGGEFAMGERPFGDLGRKLFGYCCIDPLITNVNCAHLLKVRA